MAPRASTPVYADFPSEKLTISAGVAIFHLATSRVVLCYHSRDHYYFLPKGRRNANEDTNRAAEREGFEESGYRNRLLPLPFKHRQPDPDEGPVENAVEPLWTQFLPLNARSQYLLFWYAAETVPPDVEASYNTAQTTATAQSTPSGRLYRQPSAYPNDLSLDDRIAQDKIVDAAGELALYEPWWHERTGVDEEEALYRSFLLPVDEAMQKLRGSVMEDVVRRAWQAIQLRKDRERGRVPA